MALSVAMGGGDADPAPWLMWVWRAWHALHHDRPLEVMGMAAPMGGMMIRSRPGRIPWTAVKIYADHHDIPADDMDVLVHLLGEMDGEYQAYWAERMRAQG